METYFRKPGIIETDLGTEFVLLDPSNQKMFSLNEVGSLIWRHLPKVGFEKTVEELMATYAVEPDQAGYSGTGRGPA